MSNESMLAFGFDPRLRMHDLPKILGFSQAEIYRRIDSGKLPRGIRESHRITVYLLSEIKLAIESGFEYDFSEINTMRKEMYDSKIKKV